MSINLSVGTRVRFIGRNGFVRLFTDHVGVIIDKHLHGSSYNYLLEENIVFVLFDVPIHGKREHFCGIPYLQLEQRTPEEEERHRRETHAMKYL